MAYTRACYQTQTRSSFFPRYVAVGIQVVTVLHSDGLCISTIVRSLLVELMDIRERIESHASNHMVNSCGDTTPLPGYISVNTGHQKGGNDYGSHIIRAVLIAAERYMRVHRLWTLIPKADQFPTLLN